MGHYPGKVYGSTYIFIVVFVRVAWIHLGSSAYVPSSLVLPGSVVCDANSRDPCTRFPDLCSTGGGLCVLKGPCEYECVCPPDGRRGRDCTGRGDSPNTQRTESKESSNNDGLLNSLLLFPPDFFWDMNQVLRPEESVKMMLSTTADNLRASRRTTLSPDMLFSNSYEKTLDTTAITSDPNQRNLLTNGLLLTTLQPETATRMSSTPKNQNANGGLDQNSGTTSRTLMLTTKPFPEMSSSSPPKKTTIKNTTPTFPSTPKSIDSIIEKISDNKNSNSQNLNSNQFTSGLVSAKDTVYSSTSTPPETVSVPLIQASSRTTVQRLLSSTPYFTSAPSTSTTKVPSQFINLTGSPSTFMHESTQKTLFGSDIVTTSPLTTQARSQPSIRDRINNFWKSTASSGSQFRTRNVTPQEQFPGHQGFPTFFRDVVDDNQTKDPRDAEMSKRVHRVFFPIPQFEFKKIERRRD